MDEERIDVADPKIPRRHALPACATVRAHAKPRRGFRAAIGGRRRAVQLAGIIRRNQHPVRIRVYAVDRRPSFAAVRASEKPADFDGHMNNVRVIRVEGNALRMRLMGRARESPLLDARHLTQPGKLRPALSQVVAVI